MALSSPIISDLGLPFLEIEQVIEMIGLVITLFPISVATSFYLRESLKLLQLELGLDSLILEAEFNKISLLTIPWSITYGLSAYQ